MRRTLNVLARTNETLCGMARNLAGLLLVAMVVIVILQIVFRYVLNDSLSWTEEVSRTMMVWTAFLVAPWAYRTGANVRIELFVNEMSQTLQRVLGLLINLAVLWIVVVFFNESFGFWQRGTTVRADSLPIQVSWFYAVVPAAFLLLLLASIELLLRNVLSLRFPDEDFAVPHSDDVFEAE